MSRAPSEGDLRFAFGENWKSFATHALDPSKIARAREDFARLLDGIPLAGRTFLDIGYGQGLALCLAAEQGAAAIGIDIDPVNQQALAGTAARFASIRVPDALAGSILDADFVRELRTRGPFDVVHSWGVLHHTGAMRAAIANTLELVKPGGHLVLALYTRHITSPIWLQIKRFYNRAPKPLRRLMIAAMYPPLYAAAWISLRSSPHGGRRGMDFYHDVVDWVGGYPYDYIEPDEVFRLVGPEFSLIRRIPPAVPTGNNEYVFRRTCR